MCRCAGLLAYKITRRIRELLLANVRDGIFENCCLFHILSGKRRKFNLGGSVKHIRKGGGEEYVLTFKMFCSKKFRTYAYAFPPFTVPGGDIIRTHARTSQRRHGKVKVEGLRVQAFSLAIHFVPMLLKIFLLDRFPTVVVWC